MTKSTYLKLKKNDLQDHEVLTKYSFKITAYLCLLTGIEIKTAKFY